MRLFLTKIPRVHLIDGIETIDVVQDWIVKAAPLHLLAALLRLVQSLPRPRVAKVLGTAVPQVIKVVRLGDGQLSAQVGWRAGAHHVEHVVVALVRALQAHPGLLQQIMGDVAADHLTLGVEMHFHKFAKARAVVVALRLRVAERLQHRIRYGSIDEYNF